MDDARVILRGEFDTADIKKGSKEVEGVLERLGKTVKALGLGVIIKKSFDKATKAISECVGAFKEAQVAVTKFDTIAKTLGFTNEQISGLQAYATELQGLTGMSDEAILGAEQLLLATNSLDEEGIKKATLSCANLAVAMGTDITASAQALSIALQAPSDGLTRLRRSGILFTDEEEALVKSLDEAGRKAEAQAVILDKIQSRYKGVAEAVGNTDIGTLDKISETWGDVKENLGEAILNSVQPALDYLLSTLKWIKDWQDGQKTPEAVSKSIYEWGKGNLAMSDPEDQLSLGGLLTARINKTWEGVLKGFFQEYSAKDVEAVIDSLAGSTSKDDQNVSRHLQNALDHYFKWDADNMGTDVADYWRGRIKETLSANGFATTTTKALLQSLGIEGKNANEMLAKAEEILGKFYNPISVEEDATSSSSVGQLADELAYLQDMITQYGSNSDTYKDNAITQQITDLQTALDIAENNGLASEATIISEAIETLNKSLSTYVEPEEVKEYATALEELFAKFDDMNNGDWAKVGFNAFAEGIDALGQALAGNEDAWGNWAKSVIDSISSVIMSHGYEMLAEGTLKLFNTITMAEGMAEIAKSAGVIALGGVVKGLGNSFESGGIVGGSGYTGDRHMIFANAGELILNRTQQRAIASQLSNGSGGAIAINFNGTVLGDQESVSAWVYDGVQRARANGLVS